MKSPVFIVGPPRSGTKIIRDTISQFTELQTTEHNLNYIWNQDNSRFHEEIDPEELTEQIRRRIRNEFEKRFDRDKLPVEKNVHHCLRLGSVRDVFPEAKFVFIVRDGRDSIVSIRDQWQSPFDWRYFLSRKLVDVPPNELVYYGLRQVGQFFKKYLVGRDHVDVWGPRIRGIESLVERKPLLVVCALQWRRCVQRLLAAKSTIANGDFIRVSYERLMRRPKDELPAVAEFLDRGSEVAAALNFARDNYRTTSIGRAKKELDSNEMRRVQDCVEPYLAALGYEPDTEL